MRTKKRRIEIKKSVRLAYRPLCLGCGTCLDGATGITGRVYPKVGHISICAHCGEVQVFGKTAMQPLTPAGRAALSFETRQVLHDIQNEFRQRPLETKAPKAPNAGTRLH